MPDQREAVLRVEGDCLVVSDSSLKNDRTARLLFASLLGGTPTEDGWRIPKRRLPLTGLILRVNMFLENKGWRVRRDGITDDTVQREIERRQSFQRARAAAASLRGGEVQIDLDDVRRSLIAMGWNEQRPLLTHQEEGVVHGLTAINAANFSVPGSGKTATAIAVAAAHFGAGTMDLLLVVGPLSCFRPWEAELALTLPARALTPVRIRGAATHRRRLYSSLRRGHVGLVSFASAAADRLHITSLCHEHRVMLIIDESHRIKRFRGGLWAPALMEIAKHARMRMILSGTPMPESGRDLYSQLNILWPSAELTGPRDDFALRVDRDFGALLADIRPFISRAPKEALALPPLEILRHEVALVGTQVEVYDLIESNFRRRIENADTWQEKLAALRRARPIRLIQATSNPDLLNKVDRLYGIPRVQSPSPTLMERLAVYREIESPAKSIAALDLVQDITAHGEKVVVWSNFVLNLDQFAELVRTAVEFPCFQVDGRLPTDDEPVDDDPAARRRNPADVDTREQRIEDFLDTRGPAILVTDPAACSESISLHRGCHNAIYLDRTYDCALFLQSIDRVHRLGLPEDARVRIHILMATCSGTRTIDHVIDAALRAKEATMRQLLEGAELRPFHLAPSRLNAAEGDDADLADLLRFLLGEDS